MVTVPVIIWDRRKPTDEHTPDVFEQLRELGEQGAGGIFHTRCYGGDYETSRRTAATALAQYGPMQRIWIVRRGTSHDGSTQWIDWKGELCRN